MVLKIENFTKPLYQLLQGTFFIKKFKKNIAGSGLIFRGQKLNIIIHRCGYVQPRVTKVKSDFDKE